MTTVSAVLPAQADEVDDYLKAEMAKHHIPGLSVGILRDGKIVKARGYGLANVEFAAPATEETVYNLASVTHAFTGTAVMMLVEEGKISLDEKASKYLPDLPSTWGGVTVRHLLSHTSGLPDYVNVSGASSERRAVEVVKKLAPLPVEFLPGEKWAYNQTGYVLLGMIVEQVTGVSYPRFVEDRILKPLGLAVTRFGGDRDVIKNLNPTWYTWENGALGRTGGISYPTWAYPGAGLTSTVTDLAKFDAALSAEKLLKKASLEQMWAPAKLNNGEKAGGKVLGYGLGWAIIDHRGRMAVGHGGGTNNWIVHFVDDKLTVIVLCNLFKADALSLAKGIADFYLGLAQATEKKKPHPVQQATDLGPEVDRAVQPLLKGKKGVGIVVAVIDRHGQRVFGYGTVAVKGGKAPDGDTVFEIGSITKVFTTLVLAQMVRDGEVKLDDRVKDYLPQEAKVPRRNEKEITLLHLATHTSGLPIAPTDIRWHVLVRPSDWDNPYAHYGTKQLYAFLAKYTLPRDPGDSYDYSNVGMGLLGMALTQRAKARSYDELISHRVGDPLGMKDTRITLSAGQRARFAQGHDDDGEPTSAWDFETMEGSAALRSTANDLLRFLSANMGLTQTKLQAALEDCHKGRQDTPDKQVRVGLGWHLLSLPGASEPVICHSGETGGSRAFLGFCKASGVGVVVLSNSAQLSNQIDLVALTVLGKLPAPPGQIAFMREGKVWVIGADGSGERALTDTLFYKTERPITWSPDGRRVLFWNHSKVGWDIWAVTADGKESANLTQVKSGGCRSPVCSPDGKRIAFLRDDPEGLYLMDADGSNQRRLADKAERDYPPTWSPDGKRLAYTVLEDGRLSVCCHDLASGRNVRVVHGSSPSWSPDGRRLLFVAVRDKTAALALISPDGTDEVQLKKEPGGTWYPAWSPDGSRIAYFTSRDGKAELRVITTDQKTEKLLATVEGRWSSAPSWSPDGKWLTFAAGPPQKQVMYVVDEEGRGLQKLATGGACFPAWRPAPKDKDRP